MEEQSFTTAEVVVSSTRFDKHISLGLGMVINAPVLLKCWVLVGRMGCRRAQESADERKNVP